MKFPEQPQVRNDLLVDGVDDQLVIVDGQSAHVCYLNPTASLIWSNLDGKTNIGMLVNEVCKTFEVEDHVAESDIKVFLSDLMALGLLK